VGERGRLEDLVLFGSEEYRWDGTLGREVLKLKILSEHSKKIYPIL
jgi:hypothetical protein